MSVPVVLDCDTGTDDAVAIMVAALHPGLELLGVTTVWGNHDVRHTTDNSLRVLDLVGCGGVGGVGVHPGWNGPVRPRLEELPPGRADLPATLPVPASATAARGPAVEWLVETLRGTTRPVTVVPTGPLTNLAAAVVADPGIVEAVGGLVVLGGTHRESGVTPYAERNVWCDPEAAHDVLTAGFRDVFLVTMDATFSAPLTAADTARLRAVGTVAAATAADFVDARIDWYRRDPAMAALGAAPLHDPLAVACLLDPAVVEVREAWTTVERTDPTTYGATRFTFAGDEPVGAPVRVALGADHDRFLDLLEEALAAGPRIG
ncbi:nucleoside hydrolase [Nocardioides sp. HM23]|uniref:nucleoside hydrolase n=1 Tax=Nocardioides bizhenqiangii TaxID=3095076 RepID=UPI002ACACEBB|nr:nucleoside hydrolase [Nocardioides sp. HM23]MDZ5620752.1 nucleoside hydrolase [Nocardioides sp. HM23]